MIPRSTFAHPTPMTPARPSTTVRPMRDYAALDDARLTERALAGERWAEEALYRRHAQRMHDVATRLLGRYAEADDAVQDAFVTAFTTLESLRDPARFEAWLYRILLNIARGRLRRWRLLRRFGLDGAEDDGALARTASPDVPAEVVAELSRVDEVLARVDADSRIVWILNRVEGWTLGEIAERMGTSLPTAKRCGWRVDALLAEHVEAIERVASAARRVPEEAVE